MRLTTVILAAGESRRMGRPKQLLPWGHTTLLGHAVTTALGLAVGPVVVVTGAHRERVEDILDSLPVRTVHNPHWPSGMASSLRAGTQDAVLTDDPAGLLVLLADQPGVDGAFLQPLLDSFRRAPNRTHATDYGDRPGVPAVFPPARFADLLALDGPRGAQPLLAGLGQNLVTIVPPAPPVDLDTPEDYAAHAGDHPDR